MAKVNINWFPDKFILREIGNKDYWMAMFSYYIKMVKTLKVSIGITGKMVREGFSMQMAMFLMAILLRICPTAMPTCVLLNILTKETTQTAKSRVKVHLIIILGIKSV